jgi:hypothetical protein
MNRWLWTILLAAPVWAGELKLGRAAVKITPPAGVPMAGYYSIRLAEGTHDDLYARAVVFELDTRRAAIVACDLVGIDRDLIEESRKLIETSTGIPGRYVLISATHSHTGPLLRPRFLAAMQGPPLEAARKYRTALPARIAESVRLAMAATEPAVVSASIGKEESIAFHRRFLMKDGTVRTNPGKMNPAIVQPMGAIDPNVSVVYFESAQGKPLVTHVNYALHLDTVGGTQYSADYPYTLSSLLAKVKGADMLTQFTIGAAGNINHVDVKNREPQKGYAEAARIGTILAGEVIKSYARLEKLPVQSLNAASELVPLPLPAVTAAEVSKARETAATFGKTPATPMLDMVQAFKVLDVAERNGKPLEGEVQVITLGDRLAWVGLPGEMFVELGMAIKHASPFPYTIVTELSNGAISYVPTRKAFSEGAYEVISARCAAGCGEALADAAIRQLVAAHRSRAAH